MNDDKSQGRNAAVGLTDIPVAGNVLDDIINLRIYFNMKNCLTGLCFGLGNILYKKNRISFVAHASLVVTLAGTPSVCDISPDLAN